MRVVQGSGEQDADAEHGVSFRGFPVDVVLRVSRHPSTVSGMTQDMQTAERGDIFGTPDGQIARVTRVGQAGWVTVQIVGGERDGYTQRMRHGVPGDWSRYPRP